MQLHWYYNSDHEWLVTMAKRGKWKDKDNHFQIQCYILFMYKAFEIYTYFFYNSKPYSSESFRWPTFVMNTKHCYACLHSFQIHAASNFDWVTSEAFIVCSANRNFVAPQETQDPPLLPLQSYYFLCKVYWINSMQWFFWIFQELPLVTTLDALWHCWNDHG